MTNAPDPQVNPIVYDALIRLERMLEALTSDVSDVRGDVAVVRQVIDRLDERLPEATWYCPRETVADYKRRAKALAVDGWSDDQIICEGGYRLLRHGGKAAEEKDPDHLWHPVPPAQMFRAEFDGLGWTQVRSHALWRSKALSPAEAMGRGLTLRDDYEGTAEAAAQTQREAPAATAEQPPREPVTVADNRAKAPARPGGPMPSWHRAYGAFAHQLTSRGVKFDMMAHLEVSEDDRENPDVRAEAIDGALRRIVAAGEAADTTAAVPLLFKQLQEAPRG